MPKQPPPKPIAAEFIVTGGPTMYEEEDLHRRAREIERALKVALHSDTIYVDIKRKAS